LILRKIIKNVATTCQILRLKCIKFGWGSAQTPLGSLQHFPDPLVVDLKGPTSKGREEREERGWEGKRRGEGIAPFLKF